MDILLSALQTKKSVTPTEWQEIEAVISSFGDVDAARDALNTLVDTYNEYSDSPADVVCREAIVHTLVLLLKEASAPLTPSGVTEKGGARKGTKRARKATAAATWELNSEDCLLLAMFLNDLSTVVHEGVFRNLCQCVALLYKVSYAFLYELGDIDEAEKENRRSLLQELHALRTALAKRLTSTATQLNRPRLQLVALDGCFAVLRLHWAELPHTAAAAPQKEVEEDVKDMLKGLLGPFDVALEGLVKAGGLAPKVAVATAKGEANKRNTYVASPLLLGAILYRLEELLWGVQLSADKQSGTRLSTVCQYMLNELLTVFQKYVTLQQHRQTDSLQPTGADDGSSHSRDAFRVYGVQRAIQRTLSVALHVQEALPTESEGASLASLRTGLLAAVNAFGGVVPITAPVRNDHEEGLPGEKEEEEEEEQIEKEVPTWNTADREEEGEGGSGRVRSCAALVQVQEEEVQGAQTDALVEGLDDDNAAYSLLSGKDALIRMSFGVVSPSTLAEMVMYSISQLDYLSEDHMQDLHRAGLEVMQYEAALRAQREELERQRLVEQQGIEAIPAAKLIEHVKDSTSIQQQGMQLLRRPSARAHLQRCAFRNILQSYEYVQGEAEERLRITQALIARCLVQMPPTLADVALDDVLLRLSGELLQDAAQKDAYERNGGPRSGVVSRPSSYYQLLLQILFTSFSSLAPFEDREENTFLLLAEAAGAASGGALLRSTPHMTINTENPIGFMQEVDTHVPSYLSGSRKRPRLDNGSEYDADGYALEEEGGSQEGDHFTFLNDTRGRSSAYSHLLCRVMELMLAVYRSYLQSEKLIGSTKLATYLEDTLLDVLLQAPSLPRYVWHYIYKQLCLSTERDRCIIGTWLLGRLTVHRVVYRDCAFNLLIHLCMSTNEYARRLSIYHVGLLLAQQHSERGGGGVSEQAEQLLLQYAQKQVAVIPGYQPSSAAKEERDDGDVTAEAQTTTTTGDAYQQELIHKAKLNRHLGLFLMLCTRQPRQLFGSLLEMYKQCVERQNTIMAHLIPSNKDIYNMTQLIFKRDPTAFVSYVMPSLRRYSKEAAPLVQVMLWALSEQIRAMSGGSGAGGEAAAALPKVVEAMLGHVKAMYERAEIPVGGGAAGTAVIHDIRFVAPFLSFLTASELRQTYLRSFLYFVQVQLQLQRQYQSQTDQLAMRNSHYVLAAEDLTRFIKQVVREVIVKCPVAFEDQQPRGLSRVELMVYLHRAPQESHTEAAAGERGQQQQQQQQGKGATAAVRLPPISATTTKEVVHVCLDLTRSFDSSTIEKLYGPEEMEKAVRKMLHPPPIPSQLMVTILMAAALFVRNRHTDFLRFVVQNVLVPFGRANTWETNPQLWKGVLVFAENYYKVCSNFLVNLPDQVLMEALRERPQLCDYFKEEHGNNATFGHILGNL